MFVVNLSSLLFSSGTSRVLAFLLLVSTQPHSPTHHTVFTHHTQSLILMHWGKFVVHHLVQRYFDLQTRGSSLLLPDMGNMRNVQIGEGCAAYWTEHTGFWQSIACGLYVRCYLIISTLCSMSALDGPDSEQIHTTNYDCSCLGM